MTARLLIASLAASLIATLTLADDADVKKTAKAKADETQTALIKGDFGKLADLTHPKAVEALGGKEKMVTYMTAEAKKMKAEGFEFKSAKVLDPGDPIRVGKDIYIGVPFTLEMTAPGGRLHTKSLLVGVSKDNGKTWVFVDSVPGREKLKMILPDLPEGIVIPKSEPPTYIKD